MTAVKGRVRFEFGQTEGRRVGGGARGGAVALKVRG